MDQARIHFLQGIPRFAAAAVLLSALGAFPGCGIPWGSAPSESRPETAGARPSIRKPAPNSSSRASDGSPGSAEAPYWVLYAAWWSDHRDLLGRLDQAVTAADDLHGLFIRAEDSLRRMGSRLDGSEQEILEDFFSRYDDLRKEALADTVLSAVRERLHVLGREISERYGGDRTQEESSGTAQ